MTILQLRLNPNLYLKDPQSTDLGKKMIQESIAMIDDMGFEAFTFKKLSQAIESTEASIYRYFENKHKLLIYLIAWYWSWMEHQIAFKTNNIPDAEERLLIALRTITEKKAQDENFPDIDEPALQRIVIAESDKTYLTREVDVDNRDGLFLGYKALCKMISSIIQEINQEFPYPNSLVSTCLEASNQQIFFAEHLPTLSEMRDSEDPYSDNFEFLKTLVLKAISN